MIKIIRKLTPIIKKYSKFLKFLRVIFTRQQLTDKNSFIFKHSQEYKEIKKNYFQTLTMSMHYYNSFNFVVFRNKKNADNAYNFLMNIISLAFLDHERNRWLCGAERIERSSRSSWLQIARLSSSSHDR